jgi:L-aminopeptidase/D-esterase-like protein
VPLEGPALDFELPGLLIGAAEYDEGPTGCTVFRFPDGAAAATDVRGGSPGVLGGYEWVDAICFAGGSLPGLEAASGVTAGIMAERGHAVGWTDIPLVSAAIIFDYGRRRTAVYPDRELGRAALAAARPGWFPLGARGAGRSASVGKTFGLGQGEQSGQGAAFRRAGGVRIAVFSVVNALGAVVDRAGRVVRGHLDPERGLRGALVAQLEERLERGLLPRPLPGNTTLTVVVTDLRLDPRSLRQLGRQVHASLARAIQPFQTLVDGDVLYTVSTGAVEQAELDSISLAVVASELAWDAVLAAVAN